MQSDTIYVRGVIREARKISKSCCNLHDSLIDMTEAMQNEEVADIHTDT